MQLGAEDTESSSWDEAAAEARAIPEADRVGELLRALVLTDAVEAALAQLGYEFEDEDEDDEDESGDEEASGDEEEPR